MRSPRMQFLNPVTHDRHECLGTWKHPGKRNNKIKNLIKKEQVLVKYTKPFGGNLSLTITFNVLW